MTCFCIRWFNMPCSPVSFSVPATRFTTLNHRRANRGDGIALGVFGINVGHELGHRRKAFSNERWLNRCCSHPSTAFFISSTTKVITGGWPRGKIPASARLENRSIIFMPAPSATATLSAWRIAACAMREKRGRPHFRWHNEMIRFHVYSNCLCYGDCFFSLAGL